MKGQISEPLAAQIRELLQHLVRADGVIEVGAGPDFDSDAEVTTIMLHGVIGTHFDAIRQARRLLRPIASEFGPFAIAPRKAVPSVGP